MTQMIDTEGGALPLNEYGNPHFDIGISCSDKNSAKPYLALSVPMYFECQEGGVYDSAGVLTVDFEALLNEYLQEFDGIHGGAPIPARVRFDSISTAAR